MSASFLGNFGFPADGHYYARMDMYVLKMTKSFIQHEYISLLFVCMCDVAIRMYMIQTILSAIFRKF